MTAALIDSDPLRGASHRNAFAHLSGPFTGGAIDVPLTLDANGRSETVFEAREPIVVVAPRQPLGADAVVVKVAIGSAAPVVLTFAPYSDAGGFVLAGRPPIDAVTRRAAPFAVTVSAVAWPRQPYPRRRRPRRRRRRRRRSAVCIREAEVRSGGRRVSCSPRGRWRSRQAMRSIGLARSSRYRASPIG